MSYFPSSAAGLNYVTYPVGPNVFGVQPTSGAANAEGAYITLAASTLFACTHAIVTVMNTANVAGRSYVFDIARGASTAEVVVIPDLPASGSSSTSSTYGETGVFPIPLAVLGSTRLAVRSQCSSASSTMNVAITLITTTGTFGQTSFTNLGSGGAPYLSIDPGGTTHTKGAYGQAAASTSADYSWLMFLCSMGWNTYTTCQWSVDMAQGASTFEVVLIPDVRFMMASDAGTRGLFTPPGIPFLTYVAASTRLAFRCSCSVTTATARLLNIGLLAAVAPLETGAGTTFTSNQATNAAVDGMAALLNGGFLDIYNGTQPVDANTAIGSQVKLARLGFGTPAFAAASAGVALANAMTADSDADASGLATWYRLCKSDGSAVLDGAVGVTLLLEDPNIVIHTSLNVASFQLTLPEHA